MYTIQIDKIFIPYVKTFNASMLSLWAVGQPFFLKWVEQQKGDMALEAKSSSPSSILIEPLVNEIRKNNFPDDKKGQFFTELIQNFCVIFCVASFDRLQEDLRFSQIKDKEIVQFFRHIRNGCAHGNRFYFKTYTDKQTCVKVEEPTKPAKFRVLEITRQLIDDNKNVFFDFLAAGDIPYLIEDVSRELANVT